MFAPGSIEMVTVKVSDEEVDSNEEDLSHDVVFGCAEEDKIPGYATSIDQGKNIIYYSCALVPISAISLLWELY